MKENKWRRKVHNLGGEEEWRRKRRKIFGEEKYFSEEKEKGENI